jgi:hypothetical protein
MPGSRTCCRLQSASPIGSETKRMRPQPQSYAGERPIQKRVGRFIRRVVCFAPTAEWQWRWMAAVPPPVVSAGLARPRVFPKPALLLGSTARSGKRSISILCAILVVRIALIDTALYRRKYPRGRHSSPAFTGRHDRRDTNWIAPKLFARGLSGPLTPNAEAYVRPMIEKAAFVWSINDACAMLAAFALLGLVVVPLTWRTEQASAAATKAN